MGISINYPRFTYTLYCHSPSFSSLSHCWRARDINTHRRREYKDDLRSTEVNGHQRRSAVECSNSAHHSLEICLVCFDVNHLYAHWTGAKPRRLKIQETLGFGLRLLRLALYTGRGNNVSA
ncbi:hypothetical protein EVAR_83999_1 [Eumeta japonica]|uniref:Uncharacterized protein n=1 Tax=Eumeta variegata TaxID=151549 RepID=A0A4C1X8Y6_EUMVA|nr:hypothetical protein EVAR_83999_1 [Eumeta japonica]